MLCCLAATHCLLRGPLCTDPHFTDPADMTAHAPAAGEDVEARGELERKFAVLCDKEAQLMAEIAALRDAAVV